MQTVSEMADGQGRSPGAFDGRVALVVGAAAGVGEATARRFALGGALVALADRDGPGVERLASQLGEGGADVLALCADATSGAAVASMVQAVVDRFGRLDILVNCVGGWTRQRTVEATTEEEWTAGLALNVTSAFLCSKAAIPHLVASGRGRIVNVSSETARVQVHLTTPDYVAGKAAVLALTRYLAKELGPRGVTVNAVAPGPTWSPRTRLAWSEALVQQMQADSALGRIADPDDVAAVIAFLASDAARYVTGATVDVTGGHVLV